MRTIDEVKADFKNADLILRNHFKVIEGHKEEERHYHRDNRIRLEVWKKYMIRRNPSKVSFIVHN